MKKIKEAQEILKALGLEKAQQNDMSALTLLALSGVLPRDAWKTATNRSLKVSKGVMLFVAEKYRREYAPNTRETFRRQVLHQFTQAGVTAYNPDNPNLPVNSPNAHYALTSEALVVIQSFGTPAFKKLSIKFRKALDARLDQYRTKRDLKRIPLTLGDGTKAFLSPGLHNEIEVAVVTEFGPRFAEGARILYLGDTENKDVIFDKEALTALGCKIIDHGKLPDVILFQEQKKWLYLVEAVASHGPMSQKRVTELKDIFGCADIGLIFVTAFPDLGEFKKHAREIAWDTEVWIADAPDHLIHYNGDRFVGPR